MRFKNFLTMAQNMVIQYYSRYIDEGMILVPSDITTEYTINNKEVLVVILYVTGEEDNKYVVSYDKKTQKLNSYLTKKIDELVR